MTEDHDGAGQAPDDGTQPKIETDQTRAEATLETQRGSKGWDPTRVPAEVAADSEPRVKIEMLHVDVEPRDPELRLAPLYAALAKAQGAFPEIKKTRTAKIRPQTGDPWEYNYADLSDLIKAVRKPLSDNGLGFYQHPTEDGKSLATVVFHETGLDVTTLYPMHQTTGGRMHPAQNYSVGGTYAKRNGLSAALGVASEETVEGDQSAKTSPDFEAASGDGVLSVRGVVVPEGATQADKARLFAEAIEVQMQAASTLGGLEGVWRRNLEVINALQDHSQDNYQNIVEAHEQCKAAIGEE